LRFVAGETTAVAEAGGVLAVTAGQASFKDAEDGGDGDVVVVTGAENRGMSKNLAVAGGDIMPTKGALSRCTATGGGVLRLVGGKSARTSIGEVYLSSVDEGLSGVSGGLYMSTGAAYAGSLGDPGEVQTGASHQGSVGRIAVALGAVDSSNGGDVVGGGCRGHHVGSWSRRRRGGTRRNAQRRNARISGGDERPYGRDRQVGAALAAAVRGSGCSS
jgi:hypothetical protein